MRVGVVSDVHNQVQALEYALEHLQGCDLVLNLGDLVSEYRVDSEIIRVARETDLLSIVGNHEKTILLHPATSLRNRLATADLEYLTALPASRAIVAGDTRILVAHGAPWDDALDYRCEYLFEQNCAGLSRLESLGEDVILIGHTHLPMLVQLGGTLVLNPGSCGEGRDAQRRLTFAELDFDESKATIFEIRFGASPNPLKRLKLGNARLET
jgi:putative phosphoesterase